RLLQVGRVIRVVASVESDRRTETRRLVAESIEALKIKEGAVPRPRRRVRSVSPEPLILYLDSTQDTEKELMEIHEILKKHSGATPVYLYVELASHGPICLRTSEEFSVSLSPDLQRRLAQWT